MQKIATIREAWERKYTAQVFGGKVNVPILADAVANFECRFMAKYRPSNWPLIVGEVFASHINIDEEIKRLVNLGKGYQLR